MRVLSNLRVDGYYEDPYTHVRNVLQFHGCFYHSCPKCYPTDRDRIIGDDKKSADTFNMRYEQTLSVANKIRNLGYNLIEKWECDFDRELRDQKNYSESVAIKVDALNPRNAFFGSRTENFCKYH